MLERQALVKAPAAALRYEYKEADCVKGHR
jgi:hypothetical protein